jgi:hypothetical protein
LYIVLPLGKPDTNFARRGYNKAHPSAPTSVHSNHKGTGTIACIESEDEEKRRQATGAAAAEFESEGTGTSSELSRNHEWNATGFFALH